MNVSKRSDQVFQLSLTEIAFTITFILLLLLGYLVMRESEARKKAEEDLAKVQDLKADRDALEELSKRLKEGLAGTGSTDPEEVISRLVADAKAAAERDRLLVRVKDLEAQLSSLSELKRVVTEAAVKAGAETGVDRVVAALALQSEVEQVFRAIRYAASAPAPAHTSAPDAATSILTQSTGGPDSHEDTSPESLGAEEMRTEVRRSIEVTAALDQALGDFEGMALPVGREAESVVEMVHAAQSLRALQVSGKGVDSVLKENADLRGQMANVRRRLNAVGRGLDHPPCWADEAGNIEYLFNVELREGTAIVTPAWSDHRQQDAEQLPGVSELIAGPVDFDRFRASSRPILDISKRQDPECRHFVVIDNTIEARIEADQARWMVEEFFYKREARR